MTMSSVYTDTYTIVDLRRVFDQFAADYDMAAQLTELASYDHVTRVVHDIKALAENGYIWRVDIVLLDRNGRTVHAKRYVASTDASLWPTQRPGDNRWPRTPGGSLRVVVAYTDVWRNLSLEAVTAFCRNVLWLPWSWSDIDTTYPGLLGQIDRRYASNGYGLERTTFAG